MKKLAILSLVLFLSFTLLSPTGFALLCKNSQGPDQSDECWTEIRVPKDFTSHVVSEGSVMVYDFTYADTADKAAFYAVPSTTSNDDYKIAGVAQARIATGDMGMVLVRGKGKIRLAPGAITATGDRLYVSTQRGCAGTGYGLHADFYRASANPIAFALQASTAASATIDSYIIVN